MLTHAVSDDCLPVALLLAQLNALQSRKSITGCRHD
jgi:hypothetical protein